jgi:hypothetical protein
MLGFCYSGRNVNIFNRFNNVFSSLMNIVAPFPVNTELRPVFARTYDFRERKPVNYKV